MNSTAGLTLANPAVHDSPYELYELLRSAAPVYLDPVIGIYVVTGAAELKSILNDHETFSSVPDTRVMAFYSNAPWVLELYDKEGGWAPMSTLVTTDPPDHRRYRSLVEKAVGASNVRTLRESVNRIANELVDGFADRGRTDFQKEFSLRLPVFVIGDLLGMPRRFAEELRNMAESTTRLAEGTQLGREELTAGHRAQISGQKIFHEYIERYRHHPEDNLLSQLVNARLDTGESLNEREMHSVIQALLVGGNDTTPGALGNCVALLARDAELQSRLRQDSRLVAPFVEEALRLESPVQGLYRRTTRDVELGGVRIPAGSTLTVRYAAANRDGKLFERPDAVDLERKGIRNHFAFGGGIHYCVGNILARMEVNVSMEVLLHRLGDIELDPPDFVLHYVPKLVVRNPVAVPITFRKLR